MNTTNHRSLSDRLDLLERENRQLKRCFYGALVIASMFMMLGADTSETGEASFDSITAKRVAIKDRDGTDRLVLELDRGEPSLTMRNHEGMRQVRLGINEEWNDSAYLSLCSRLENGTADKQALLIATPTQGEGAGGFGGKLVPGNAQLLLYDPAPKQKSAAKRHLMRLASGRLAALKPYVEIREIEDAAGRELSLNLITAEPTVNGQRFLLDTTTNPATISGLQVGGN